MVLATLLAVAAPVADAAIQTDIKRRDGAAPLLLPTPAERQQVEQLNQIHQEALAATRQRDWPTAARLWQQLVDFDSDNAPLQQRFADVLTQQAVASGNDEHFAQAMRAWERAARLAPAPDLYIAWANALSNWAEMGGVEAREDRYQQAEAQFTEAERLQAEAAGLHYNRATMYARWAGSSEGPEQLELFRRADQEFGLAARQQPDDVRVYANWATALHGMALAAPPAEQALLVQRAERYYALAAKLAPASAQVHSMQGNALLNRARTQTGRARQASLSGADAAYRQALRLAPQDGSQHLRYADLLAYRAELADARTQSMLHFHAGRHYAEAVRLDPDCHRCHYQWGRLLVDRMKVAAGTERDRLYHEADARFAEAVRLDPAAESFNAWGTLHFSRARMAPAPQGRPYFEAALGKFHQAEQLRPDGALVQFNLGSTLGYLAVQRPSEPPARLMAQALEHFTRGHALAPKDAIGLYDWGATLLAWARLHEGAEKQALLLEAEAKFAAALALAPNHVDALADQAVALALRAVPVSAGERDRLLRQADLLMARAVALAPDKVELKVDWGEILQGWANPAPRSAALSRLEKAGRKFAEAARQRPGHANALALQGLNQHLTADLYGDQDGSPRRRAALRLMHEAERRLPGVASYNLACLEARRGNLAPAGVWLRKAEEHGALPGCRHLRTDPDLTALRGTPWFQELEARHCSEGQ